ncbi:hypothetical protein WME97_35215 [Sorangium sp. So ce367]|uniref:hypothetical protein n=1 Tax=Sorangium sp. So ce367 TaxID=3133305 RepID=UPI003F6362CE
MGQFVVAASDGLGLLVVGAVIEGNHDGGDVALWDVGACRWRARLYDGHRMGLASDAAFTRDGALVAVAIAELH